MNPVTGQKIIVVGGEPLTLRFTWAALAEIEHKYGDNPNLFDPEIVATVAAAGLREKHPDITAERIMQLSPPLMPFMRDVQQALRWAYFGAEPTPEAVPDAVKKNPSGGGWLRRFVRPFRRGSPR